jgi:hypothetical protein
MELRPDPDFSPMHLDDALGDGKPQADATFLRVMALSTCWNSWKSLAWSAAEIPGPVSRTDT